MLTFFIKLKILIKMENSRMIFYFYKQQTIRKNQTDFKFFIKIKCFDIFLEKYNVKFLIKINEF